MKVNRCQSCNGEGKVYVFDFFGNRKSAIHIIQCVKCNMVTKGHKTMDEAKSAWNDGFVVKVDYNLKDINQSIE